MTFRVYSDGQIGGRVDVWTVGLRVILFFSVKYFDFFKKVLGSGKSGLFFTGYFLMQTYMC
jgi:hypothetical protein